MAKLSARGRKKVVRRLFRESHSMDDNNEYIVDIAPNPKFGPSRIRIKYDTEGLYIHRQFLDSYEKWETDSYVRISYDDVNTLIGALKHVREDIEYHLELKSLRE